jgi:hypothetical protein
MGEKLTGIRRKITRFSIGESIKGKGMLSANGLLVTQNIGLA